MTWVSKISWALIAVSMLSASLWGQAVFTVSTSPKFAVETGQAELAGSVTLTLVSGTTTETVINVYLTPSVAITNTPSTGIVVSGTEDLDSARIANISYTPPIISIAIPDGATSGSITLSGVRVALADTNVRSVQAALSVTASRISFQNTNVVMLISDVLPGLSVDPSSDMSLRVAFGTRIKSNLEYTVREGFAQAFSGSVGAFGQTVPTQIKIVVRNLLEGVSLTFPATITANETGAMLRTLSGNPITLSASGTAERAVIYQFIADSLASDRLVESFTIRMRTSFTSPVEEGSIAIQATLGPVGLREPSSGFPSTDLPRYKQQLTPSLDRTGIGYQNLYLPAARVTSDLDTGIAFANPINTEITVTFRAFTKDGTLLNGPGIVNPTTRTIPAKGQLALFASDLFNLPRDFDQTFSITATAEFDAAFGLSSFFSERHLSLQGGPQASAGTLTNFVFPRILTDDNTFTTIHLFNPNDQPARISLELINRTGETIETARADIPPHATYSNDVKNIFAAGHLADAGYIAGRSDVGLISSESFGNEGALATLNGQDRALYGSPELYLPHFVTGGGFYTEFNLINIQPQALEIAVKALDEQGELLRRSDIGENPAIIRIPPGGQFIGRAADIFRVSGDRLITGQIEMEVESFIGFYRRHFSIPGSMILGSTSGKFLTALPAVLPTARELFFPQVTEIPGLFTGITLQNPNEFASANVTIEVFKSSGELAGSQTITLKPEEKIAKLVREIIPQAYGLTSGTIRIRSNLYLTGFTLVGSEKLNYIIAAPPQVKRF